MQWNKVKTIFIVIFLLVNAYLIYYYVSGSKVGTNNLGVNINDTLTVLKDKGIEIDPEVIPTLSENVRVFDVTRGYVTKEDVATELMGDGYFMRNEKMMYKEGMDLWLNGDNFDLVMIREGERSMLDENTRKNAKKTASDFLKEKGLSNKYVELAASEENEEGNEIRFTYVVKYDKKSLFDASIRICVDNEGIAKVEGRNWLKDTIVEGIYEKQRDVSECLLNFSNVVSEQELEYVVVEEIEEGYYLGPRQDNAAVTVIPVIKMKTRENGEFLFNTKSGELVN